MRSSQQNIGAFKALKSREFSLLFSIRRRVPVDISDVIALGTVDILGGMNLGYVAVLCIVGCLESSRASTRCWYIPPSAGVTTQSNIMKCLLGAEGKTAPSLNKINFRNEFDRLIFFLTFRTKEL